MDVNAKQPKRLSTPSEIKESVIFKEESEGQYSNAESPMYLLVFGILTEVISQYSKALFPIATTE